MKQYYLFLTNVESTLHLQIAAAAAADASSSKREIEIADLILNQAKCGSEGSLASQIYRYDSSLNKQETQKPHEGGCWRTKLGEREMSVIYVLYQTESAPLSIFQRRC